MLKPAEANAKLKLRFCVDRGKSLKRVENVVWEWGELLEKLSKSVTDKLTLAEFKDRPKDWQNKRKQADGYFIGGQMKKGIRDKINEQERQILTYDIDQGTPELLKALREGTTGLGKCEYAVHSTRSHGDGTIKLRVIVPLAKLLPKDMWEAAARVGAWNLDPDMVAVDQVSFVSGQIMYWPAHCVDVKPIFIHHQGRILDVQEMLTDHFGDPDGWKNLALLPLSVREKNALRENANKIAQNPLEKRGIVGAFCRDCGDVHEGISRYLSDVYEPSEYSADGLPDRYSFIGGTSSNGVTVLDGGLHMRSYHGSDPASGLNLNIWDAVMIHKFGHLDAANGKDEEDTDPRKKKAYKAMETWLVDNQSVMAELRDSNYGMSEDDVDDSFDADDGPVIEGEAVEVTSDLFDGLPGGGVTVKTADEDDDLAKFDWRDSLDMNEKGTIKPTLRNFVLILHNAASFKGLFGRNLLTHANGIVRAFTSKSLGIRIPLERGEPFLPLTDYITAQVRHVLEAPRGPGKTGWSLRVPQRDLEHAIDIACGKNKFHPIRDYLHGLIWDGVSRIETMWTRVCHTPDNAYYRATSRNTLVAAVARVFSPGTKFDFLPVLIGLTGIRKSTFVKILGGYHWSTESPGHFDSKQKFVEASIGFWFIEHGEMMDFRRASDEEGIKFMLSGTSDNVRLSYRRNAETFHRQFVLIGTTEDTQFLRSFHRRVWPIQCGTQTLDLEWLRANRDQLFAEAVVAYRKMARETNEPELPLDLRGAANDEFMANQPAHVMPDDMDVKAGLLQVWLDTFVPPSMAKPGADRNDEADGMFDDDNEPVQRTVTCAGELFEKAMGGDLSKYGQREAQAIGRAMRLLEPVWVIGNRATCGKYGIQRTYRRVVKPPTKR